MCRKEQSCCGVTRESPLRIFPDGQENGRVVLLKVKRYFASLIGALSSTGGGKIFLFPSSSARIFFTAEKSHTPQS